MKKYQEPLKFILLMLAVAIVRFRFMVTNNEADTIPYALSVFNGDWLPNDWYLNQKIPYRFAYSYLVGFFENLFGLNATILAGRFISYVLITLALLRLIRSLEKRRNDIYLYLVLISLLALSPFIQFAGAWIYGPLDTKAFAYAFSILSLVSVLNNQLRYSLFFAGASLSFHMLIGAYHMICLSAVIVYMLIDERKTIIRAISNLPFFLLSGCFGIYGIAYHLLHGENSSNALGWLIYVNIRVPHHTLPRDFLLELTTIGGLSLLINVIILLFDTRKTNKLLAVFCLSTILISLSGLVIYWLGETEYLRYYFFRFGGALLAILTLLNAASVLIQRSKKELKTKKRLVMAALSILCFLLLIPYFMRHREEYPGSFDITQADDQEMIDWVKKNTDNTDVFILPPNKTHFYLYYERPRFVSSKHSPQSSEHMIEWYNRMKLLNKNQDFKGFQQVRKNYILLNRSEILDMQKSYPELKYVLMPKKVLLDFPLQYESKLYRLYEIN